MADRPATAFPAAAQVPAAGLEPDAIGVSQDTVIGMANAAPAVSVGLTLAALALATAYAIGPIGSHVLPLRAAVFLVWLLIKSLLAAPAPQLWSVASIAASGVVLIFVARFVLRSPFFQIPRESATPEG